MAIDTQTIQKAHEIMFDMLKVFDKICKENNLQYWLDAGTLLGAIRHDGFIPWDDDVDISMPIDDYNKFRQIAQASLPRSMFLQDKESDPLFGFDYMKIRDARANIIEFHEEGKDVGYHQGLFLDIFPMFAIKNTPIHKAWYNFAFSSICFFSAKKFKQDFIRSLFVKSVNSLHVGWRRDDTKVIYGGEMPDVAKWYDYKDIFPLKEESFEGLKFSSVNNPEAYLVELYGQNYMEIPPKEKQSVHASKIEFNHS